MKVGTFLFLDTASMWRFLKVPHAGDTERLQPCLWIMEYLELHNVCHSHQLSLVSCADVCASEGDWNPNHLKVFYHEQSQ